MSNKQPLIRSLSPIRFAIPRAPFKQYLFQTWIESIDTGFVAQGFIDPAPRIPPGGWAQIQMWRRLDLTRRWTMNNDSCYLFSQPHHTSPHTSSRLVWCVKCKYESWDGVEIGSRSWLARKGVVRWKDGFLTLPSRPYIMALENGKNVAQWFSIRERCVWVFLFRIWATDNVNASAPGLVGRFSVVSTLPRDERTSLADTTDDWCDFCFGVEPLSRHPRPLLERSTRRRPCQKQFS